MPEVVRLARPDRNPRAGAVLEPALLLAAAAALLAASQRPPRVPEPS